MITQQHTVFALYVIALKEGIEQPAVFALEKSGTLRQPLCDCEETLVLEADGGYYIAVKDDCPTEGTLYRLEGTTYVLVECCHQGSGVSIWFAVLASGEPALFNSTTPHFQKEAAYE